MTEQEWLACADPDRMLTFLEGKASKRKLRLLVVGGCRRVWKLFAPWEQEAVETSEQFADGAISQQHLAQTADPWNTPTDGGNPGDAHYAICGVLGPLTNTHDVRNVLDQVTVVIKRNPRRFESWYWPLISRGHAGLVRCIFGNPFHPVTGNRAWLTPTVLAIAEAIYAERAFDRLPILADALEDAGCANAGILGHCRQPGEHVRGCWVVDLVTGRG